MGHHCIKRWVNVYALNGPCVQTNTRIYTKYAYYLRAQVLVTRSGSGVTVDIDDADTRSQIVQQRTLQCSSSVGAPRPAGLGI